MCGIPILVAKNRVNLSFGPCCDRQCRILTILPLIALPDLLIWLIHEIYIASFTKYI